MLDSPIAKSKSYNLELLDLNPIDLCGKEYEREVTIAPYMGQIVKSDSMYGFEISIQYDPEVVQMNQKLFNNTISQFFEYKDVTFDSERGEIVMDGLLTTKVNAPPVAGDMPLVAFSGKFIGQCEETANFKVNYFYPIDGFKGKIDTIKSISVKGKIVDKPTRSIGYKIDAENREIVKDSTIVIPISLDLGELTNLNYWETKINLNIDSLEIGTIVGTSSVEIEKVTKPDSNSYLVEYKVLDNIEPKLFIELKSFKKDSSQIKLDLETIKTSECICATRFPSSSVIITNLQTKDSIVNTSVEEYNPDYEIVNNMIIPKTGSLNIEVYNINGMLIGSKVCNVNQVYDTKQDVLGIYFVKITSKDKTRIIKIINN